MKYTFESKIGINDSEVSYARKHGLNFSEETILMFEPCRKKDRKILTNAHIPKIQSEIINLKAEYPAKRVIWVEQFKKQMKKTPEQVEVAIKCSTFNGSDAACLYESDPQQDIAALKSELPSMVGLSQEYETFFVIEMESEQVREKVAWLIQCGIKNFIFMSGSYPDTDLWYDLITKVRISGGEAIVVLLKRMHPTTKKSYIERAIVNGASLAVHGALYGGGEKDRNRINLFLDSTDLIYKGKNSLPLSSSIYSNMPIKNKLGGINGNLDSEYEISRLSALEECQSFCDSHKLVVII